MKFGELHTPESDEASAESLYAAIAALKSAQECRRFFQDLCTPSEIQAMADRWRVVGLLQKGIPYREIQEQTGVSVTTIGRVARFLVQGNGGYELIAKRLNLQGKHH
ncbi:MAG: YerC/YecD family TrpR-related protein [Gammaproteobacteria bacterium]|nr:YerC/YecD family TrpR-related protein [Gammaproteobacteria bacterium]